MATAMRRVENAPGPGSARVCGKPPPPPPLRPSAPPPLRPSAPPPPHRLVQHLLHRGGRRALRTLGVLRGSGGVPIDWGRVARISFDSTINTDEAEPDWATCRAPDSTWSATDVLWPRDVCVASLCRRPRPPTFGLLGLPQRSTRRRLCPLIVSSVSPLCRCTSVWRPRRAVASVDPRSVCMFVVLELEDRNEGSCWRRAGFRRGRPASATS